MLERLPPLCAGWVFVILCSPAHAQTTLREWRGATNGDALGSAIANVGDVDGDGVDDLAIGMPGDDTVAGDAGAVVIASGATGREWKRFLGATAKQKFGSSVNSVGDVDDDGIGDLIVGGYVPGTTDRQILAVSGSDGAVLWERRSHWQGDQFGAIVATLGDVDLDGHSDVAVSIPWFGPSGSGFTWRGRVRVFSGTDGGLLHEIDGTFFNGEFGNGLAAAGDLDADGHADFWASEYEFIAGSTSTNRVQARSGADGHLMFTLSTPVVQGEAYGGRIVGGSDLDGDSVPDVVASSIASPYYGAPGPGHVYAFSGATHALLWTRAGTSSYLRLGNRLFAVGDLNGDGVDDLAATVGGAESTLEYMSGTNGQSLAPQFTAPTTAAVFALCRAGDVDQDGRADFAIGFADTLSSSPTVNYGPGEVRLVTMVRPLLKGNRFEVVSSAGGTQTLTLAFGPAFAGQPYRVLGSISGTHDGLPTSAGILPLAVDAYFWSSLRAANHPYLAGATGFLDANGRAVATVTVPPNSMRLPSGTVLHHAAVVLDAGGTTVTAVSRAVPFLMRVDPCLAASGASDDCDGDGMRDGCQMNLAPAFDCNKNARPDACDVAGGFSADCDGDSLPDECVAYGDMNHNGVLDACEPKTIFVDDDAPFDPGPGSSLVSDPAADGSLLHPFDAIAKALVVATSADTVLLENGLYTGPQNRALVLYGRIRSLRSRGDPGQCVIDAEHTDVIFKGGSPIAQAPFELEGITFQGTGQSSVQFLYSNSIGQAARNVRIANCRFVDGWCTAAGGVFISLTAGANALIENCVFARNGNGTNASDGYVLNVSAGGTCVMRNCLFFENKSDVDRVPVVIASPVVIDHCTFVPWMYSGRPLVQLSGPSSPLGTSAVTNSILRGNGAVSIAVNGDVCSFAYDSISGGSNGISGNVMIGPGIGSADPLFAHAAGADFHLAAGSPCIDEGDPLFVPVPGAVDGDGEARVLNGRTDIGWDEVP